MILDHQGNPAAPSSEALSALTEALEALQFQNSRLQESYSRLEFELQQAGWSKEAAEGAQEPTRDALRQAAELARFSWLKNPLPRRGVDLQASYVFAQGFSVKANDKQIDQVLREFMEDAQNQRALFASDIFAQRERELSLDGNFFPVFFPNKSTGRVKMSVIPAKQISRVITDPDNAERPWFYLREWQAEGFSLSDGPTPLQQAQAYYPDIAFHPRSRPSTIGGIDVKWDSPVMHVKVGGFSDWKMGFPETEVGRPYATAFKDFLGNWASITKALAHFSWKYSGSQSAAETAAVKEKQTAIPSVLAPGIATKAPPLSGSTAIVPAGRDLTPIPTRNAVPSADEGRQLRVMAIAASGFGDHFYGDAQQGALATAESLDRPTELRIRARQGLWTGIMRQIFCFVILWAVRAPSGALRKLGRVSLRDESDPDAMPRVIWRKAGKKPADSTINIDWPRIVEPAILTYAQALMTAAPMLPTELVSQLLMVAFEVDGIEKWMEELRKERAKAAAAEPNGPPVPDPAKEIPASDPQPEPDPSVSDLESEDDLVAA